MNQNQWDERMKFLRNLTESKARILSTALTLVVLGILISILAVSAATSTDNAAEQEQMDNDAYARLVAVRSDSGVLSIDYTFGSTNGHQAFPLGNPTITTNDGTKIASSAGSRDGDLETATFPTDPSLISSGEQATINLGFLVIFNHSSVGSVLVPAIDLGLDRSNPAERNQVVPLGIRLTIGEAVYEVTQLINNTASETERFKLVVVPMNDAAKRTEVTAGTGRATLVDAAGNNYPWIGTRTRWDTEAGGHEIAWQHLVF